MKIGFLALALSCVAVVGRAEFKPPQHPFILWTRDEAAAIRKRIETEPWAKAEYGRIVANKNTKGQQERRDSETFRNLFQIVVMSDEKVAEAEKKYLLTFIGSNPESAPGNPRATRHMDNYINVLRYDALYDRLTAGERKRIEDTFRDHIDFYLHRDTEPGGKYTRTSWLPNMQWERPLSAHFEALAIGDEKLLHECISAPGGWKWYFDEYIADGQFYCEEFGKHYSTIGEMLLFCRGLERVGLNEVGFGYTGKGGATMRRYLESIFNVGYPRTEIPGGMPHYGKITMGDARGTQLRGAPPYAFQHAIVAGFMPGGDGGNDRFGSWNMNGRDHKGNLVDKLLGPLWFELAHAKWPDAHFGYFLAQMRAPKDEMYFPSLFFGVEPIDPKRVTPPPAPSYVARERGFAFLRAEESPGKYWEGEAPAAALQFATYYVHYAHDALSLLGFHAFNRPIYLNRQISNGYGGSCPWTDSTRGHCGVIVDYKQWMIMDDEKRDHPHWPNPIGELPTRSSFDPLVKFVAVRGVPMSGRVNLDNQQPLHVSTLNNDVRVEEKEIWPGVEMSRALFLTGEYLFDIYECNSAPPHTYHWSVQALGNAQPDKSWKPTDELYDHLYETNRAMEKRFIDSIEHERYQMHNVFKLDPGANTWSATALQTCALADVNQSVLGKAWYDREIGVRIHMLGEPGTTVYAGKTPGSRTAPGKEANKGEKSGKTNEVGGTTFIVQRVKPSTTFVALHEPFKNNKPRVKEFRRIQQNDEAIAISVTGEGINDRLLFRTWKNFDQPITITGETESFTFADRGFVRITGDKVEVSGDVRAMKLRVTGSPKLFVNGTEKSGPVENGILRFD